MPELEIEIKNKLRRTKCSPFCWWRYKGGGGVRVSAEEGGPVRKLGKKIWQKTAHRYSCCRDSQRDHHTAGGPSSQGPHLLGHLRCEGSSLIWSKWGPGSSIQRTVAPQRQNIWMPCILTASLETGLGSQPPPHWNNQKVDEEDRTALSSFWLMGQIISPRCLPGPEPNIPSTLVFMSFWESTENLNWLWPLLAWSVSSVMSDS